MSAAVVDTPLSAFVPGLAVNAAQLASAVPGGRCPGKETQ